MKILVTGFEPFLGEKINPSAKILEALSGDGGVETLLLPVSFARAAPMLSRKIAEDGPYRAILMLGQAGGRSKISLERVALNWIESEHPDEDGRKPERGAIDPGEETAFFSEMPLDEWRAELGSKGHAVEVSLSAGGYVCNDLYFKLRRDHGHCLFVHVPYLPEQAQTKNAPSMPFEAMLAAVQDLLKLF